MKNSMIVAVNIFLVSLFVHLFTIPSFAGEPVSVTVVNSNFDEGNITGDFTEEPGDIPGWSALYTNSAKKGPLLYYRIDDNFQHPAGVNVPPIDNNYLSIYDQSAEAGLYILSDPIQSIVESCEYTVAAQVWSDYRYGMNMIFFNQANQVWLNGSFQEATHGNIISAIGAFDLIGVARQWVTKTKTVMAPLGSTYGKIALFGSNSISQKATCSFDKITLTFYPKIALKIEENEFEKVPSIPGWTNYFSDVNKLSNVEYYSLNSKLSQSKNALRIFKDGGNQGIYLLSNPIVVPGEREGRTLKFTFDAKSNNTSKRGNYSVSFFKSGLDGIIGTDDDLVLTGYQSTPLYYDSNTGLILNGAYYTVKNIYAISGSVLTLGFDILTSNWETYSFIVDTPEQDYDYVKIGFSQRPNLNGTDFSIDNVKLAFGNEEEGFTPLIVQNGDFEEGSRTEIWEIIGDHQSSSGYVTTTDEVKLSNTFSLKIKNTKEDQTFGTLSQPISVFELEDYELSFMVYTENLAFYDLKFFNSKGEVYNQTSKTYEPTDLNTLLYGSIRTANVSINTATLFSQSFTAPKEAAFARVLFLAPYGRISTTLFDAPKLFWLVDGIETLKISRPYLTQNSNYVGPVDSLGAQEELEVRFIYFNPFESEKDLKIIFAKMNDALYADSIHVRGITLYPKDVHQHMGALGTVSLPYVNPTFGGKLVLYFWDSIFQMNTVLPPITFY